MKKILIALLFLASPAFAQYRLATDGVIHLTDGAFIPNDPRNEDWARYQTWLNAGNSPSEATVIVNPILPTSVMLYRLTDNEYTVLMQAAASQLQAGNGQLARWLDMARTAPVNLSDPLTTTVKNTLVSAGLLTQQRADIIFSPQ